jgi:MFS family permease
MNSRYQVARGLRGYLAGATAARAGDEMSGPALLLLGFAVTGRPAAGSGLLASLMIAGAIGGPVFGALLDRSRRPDRVLAWALGGYAAGITVVQAVLGRLPASAAVPVALAAGLFSPAVAGGWTAQLPRVVTGRELDRGSALDALTYTAASLAGPALAAAVAAGFGARPAVLTAAVLVALAIPAACSLSRYRPGPPPSAGLHQARSPQASPQPAGRRLALHRQMAEGFAVIVTRRPLLPATVTSAVSYAGIGMLLVCCPVLGAERLGGAARGALLISAMAVASLAANALLARRAGRDSTRQDSASQDSASQDSASQDSASQGGPGRADALVLGSTLVMGAGMAVAAVAPGWLTVAAVALTGAGEGPQLTALFAIRHRETPARMRGQVYTTAASLKIAGLAAGAALGGPLAGHSVTACLLAAAGVELLAAASGLLAGMSRGRRAPGSARAGSARTGMIRSGTVPRGTARAGTGADGPPRSA